MSTVRITGHLDPRTAEQVRAIIGAARDADGVEAVSEQFVLRLDDAAGSERVRHALATDGDELVGYGVSELGELPSAELVVAPSARLGGTGTMLLAALEKAGGRLHAWAHGDLPAARAFAAGAGAREIRRLLEMRRPADLPVAVPEPAAGVTVRTFRSGADDAAWLRLNAAAFASHPEQGAWRQQDLDERLAEPWFDPRGFFLAERDGELVAFHWTKRHSAELGEVYVVGVHPDAQGLGLGRLMTATGLRHLAGEGVSEISLFVDGDNLAAVALYTALGFSEHRADSQWETAGSH